MKTQIKLILCCVMLVAAQPASGSRLMPLPSEQGQRLYREAGSLRIWTGLSRRGETQAEAKATCAELAVKLGRPFRLPTREELLETQARVGFQSFPDLRANADRFHFVLWSSAQPAPRNTLVLRVSKASEHTPIRVLMKKVSVDARARTRCISTAWRSQAR